MSKVTIQIEIVKIVLLLKTPNLPELDSIGHDCHRDAIEVVA